MFASQSPSPQYFAASGPPPPRGIKSDRLDGGVKADGGMPNIGGGKIRIAWRNRGTSAPDFSFFHRIQHAKAPAIGHPQLS
jgi:hypothetical protein